MTLGQRFFDTQHYFFEYFPTVKKFGKYLIFFNWHLIKSVTFVSDLLERVGLVL